MRRIATGLVVSLILLTPLPARADTPDPIKALRTQIVPGRGVTVSLITRMSADGKQFATIRTTRVAGFRKGGLVETDDISTFYSPVLSESLEADTLFPTLLIKVEGAYYASGGELIGKLPPGKKWVRSRWPESSPMDATVDLFEPGTLRALLATASSVGPRAAKGTIYTSKIPGRPFGGWSGRGEKVAWALWFDAKGRVTRLTTTTSQRTNDNYELGLSSDLRFTGWGAQVTIEPPPEDLVIEADDLPRSGSLFEESPMKIEAPSKRN
ncbi:hypothetical protein [Streptosporangium sp. NBC_01756]|uniref:hypothetical protein n=1 Tax=Streptosporangium sp. NBC_01756 TaxID=2975950 RepID=UPI002DDA90B1|nr:hypothetical protein [Streptosporangium sp. NBC_01756]WSC88410.1 hypothetical protein OIE48_09550 [Streptosporangium sp. NBC_01756]